MIEVRNVDRQQTAVGPHSRVMPNLDDVAVRVAKGSKRPFRFFRFVEPEAVQEIMDRARQDTDGLTQLKRVLGSGTRLGDPVRSVLYRQINSFNATNRKNLKGRFEPLYTPEQLAATGVPFLFLVGEEDVLFPAAAVREMHKQVNNSGYVEVKNAGHSVFFEDPDAFNSAVIEFLEQNYSG